METTHVERPDVLWSCFDREAVEHPTPWRKQVAGRVAWTLASVERKWQLAAEHFLMAAAFYDDLESHYEAAQAREQAALAQWKIDDPQAEESLRVALAEYQRLGAEQDVARCMRIARANGVCIPVPYRGGTRGYGGRLSPREQEVARLAAAGFTNKEIGAKLFLSPSTVDGHLGRAMRKLGVHSRAAVAARLLDMGAP